MRSNDKASQMLFHFNSVSKDLTFNNTSEGQSLYNVTEMLEEDKGILNSYLSGISIII